MYIKKTDRNVFIDAKLPLVAFLIVVFGFLLAKMPLLVAE